MVKLRPHNQSNCLHNHTTESVCDPHRPKSSVELILFVLCVVCNSLLVGTLIDKVTFFKHAISIVSYLWKSRNFIGCWGRRISQNMTFDILDHAIKMTFEQRTENNAIMYVYYHLSKFQALPHSL